MVRHFDLIEDAPGFDESRMAALPTGPRGLQTLLYSVWPVETQRATGSVIDHLPKEWLGHCLCEGESLITVPLCRHHVHWHIELRDPRM